jgi:hypothetical protein
MCARTAKRIANGWPRLDPFAACWRARGGGTTATKPITAAAAAGWSRARVRKLPPPSPSLIWVGPCAVYRGSTMVVSPGHGCTLRRYAQSMGVPSAQQAFSLNLYTHPTLLDEGDGHASISSVVACWGGGRCRRDVAAAGARRRHIQVQKSARRDHLPADAVPFHVKAGCAYQVSGGAG